MAKVQGTYASVVRGVSQQAPADRIEGQHAELVNMISDPVRGLVRRNGMVLENVLMHEAEGNDPTAEDLANAVEDAMSYRTYTYRAGGVDYDVLYRSRPRIGRASAAHCSAVIMYDRTWDQEKFIDIKVGTADDLIRVFEEGGISALTSVGEFVVFAGNTVRAGQTVTPVWDTPDNRQLGNVWIRGGGYSRTYTIIATLAATGMSYTASYTTPAAQYPGSLDFSGITADPSTPEYQAEVNNIQAAYDTAVNQHTASSAAAIVPAAIANELVTRLLAAGWPPEHIGMTDSTILFAAASGLEVTDGGNGEFVRETLGERTSPDTLPTIAHYKSVVKIEAPGADPYYMEAIPLSPPPAGQTWGRVAWRECPGELQTPTSGLAMGFLYNGVFYLGSSAAALQATILQYTGDTVDVPAFTPSKCGDTTTNEPPHFYGRFITCLSMFQDRLLIGSGGTVCMSQRGDYFNFYRTTTLSLPDSDPIGVYAVGSENDTIRKVTAHEMNLFVHGDKRHYLIPGRAPITPATASMGVMWEVDNAAGAQPVSNGANLFIAKEELQVGASRLLQVQPGLYQDIPALQDVSQQLRDYINGFPAEIVAFLNPGMVFIRTDFVQKSRYGFPRSRKQGLYVYQYTDQGDQRVVDAWGSWEWSEHLGRALGIAPAGFGDTLRVYTFVHGRNGAGIPVRAVNVLRASIRPDPTGLPYLDGLAVGDQAQTTGLFTPAADAAVRAQVYTSPGSQFSYEDPLVGHDPNVVLPNGPNWSVGDTNPTVIDPLRWVGVQGWLQDFLDTHGMQTPERQATIFTGLKFHAYVELTNPFMRDSQGKADTMGRLKITRMHVITTRTAGLEASWKDYDGQVTVQNYGGTYSQINYSQSLFIGRDARHVQVRIAANQWLPLTINGISWQGNWYGEKNQV